MPMAKDSQQINVTVSFEDKAIADEIRKRAKRLGWSPSAFGLEIWRYWFEQQKAAAINSTETAIILGEQVAASKRGK